MIFALLLLLLLILYGIKISGLNHYNEDYLNKKNTTAINGIFVILVVFSHYAQYAGFEGPLDEPYLIFREHMGQMVVASFLFYSGYGMMESIKRKGEKYISNLPTKSWQLLLRYDVAVFLFLIVDVAFGIEYPLSHTILAFTSWTAIGNSNWYITAILMIYLCIFLSFMIGYKISDEFAEKYGVILTFFLVIGCIYLQIRLERPGYCYNTMILAPFGMLWSMNKDLIERVIMKSDLIYLPVIAASAGLYYISYLHRYDYDIYTYSVWAIFFTILLVLITMKLNICNKIIEWFGTHVFSIYILQRLPMIILDQVGLIKDHVYISLIIVFVITLSMALVFEKGTDVIVNRIMSATGGKK